MIQIRQADVSDLPDMSRIHFRAFPDSALTLVGPEAIRRYYEWQMQRAPDLILLVAVIQDSIAGFVVAGRFHQALSGFVRAHRRFLILRVITRPWILLSPRVIRRAWAAGQILTSRRRAAPVLARASGNSAGVLSIATAPTHQGRGVGTALLLKTEQLARERGYEALHLTVSPTNSTAIRLYLHLGWKKTPDDTTWTGLMTKDIDDA